MYNSRIKGGDVLSFVIYDYKTCVFVSIAELHLGADHQGQQVGDDRDPDQTQ